MSGHWLAILLCWVVGCADDDDGADGDGDSDADAGSDGAPEQEECPSIEGVSTYILASDEAGEERPMVVVTWTPEEIRLVLEEDYGCSQPGWESIQVGTDALDARAWSGPPAGSQVITRAWYGVPWNSEGNWVEVRTPEGVLVWEGGDVLGSERRRFSPVDDPEAPWCVVNQCRRRRAIRASLMTDEGEVELSTGERRIVTVEGEPFVAVVAAAQVQGGPGRYVEGCPEDDFSGPYVSAYLARTTPVEAPVIDEPPAPTDECPVEQPEEHGSCTTRPELQCNYVTEDGCSYTYRCSGCFWDLFGRAGGIECGFDPASCLGKGCSEEAVCTDCSCPGQSGERWRCVDPGDDCPPCE